MVQEVFGSIIESIRDNFRHLTNADPSTLILVAAGIALLGYFLLKNH
jgi:hypothetical protein